MCVPHHGCHKLNEITHRKAHIELPILIITMIMIALYKLDNRGKSLDWESRRGQV